jgi:hypothetical protein
VINLVVEYISGGMENIKKTMGHMLPQLLLVDSSTDPTCSSTHGE